MVEGNECSQQIRFTVTTSKAIGTPNAIQRQLVSVFYPIQCRFIEENASFGVRSRSFGGFKEAPAAALLLTQRGTAVTFTAAMLQCRTTATTPPPLTHPPPHLAPALLEARVEGGRAGVVLLPSCYTSSVPVLNAPCRWTNAHLKEGGWRSITVLSSPLSLLQFPS